MQSGIYQAVMRFLKKGVVWENGGSSLQMWPETSYAKWTKTNKTRKNFFFTADFCTFVTVPNI